MILVIMILFVASFVRSAPVRNPFKIMAYCLDISLKKCFDIIFWNVLYSEKVTFGGIIFKLII